MSAYKDELCETCLGRLEKNPLRVLDCKSPICGKIGEGAPRLIDYICDECSEHFEGVKSALTSLGIEYNIDPAIVRGLDYYTKTVFEIKATSAIGAQNTVCGGGRYDGLVEIIGGDPTPGIGFAMGIERLLMVMEEENAPLPEDEGPDIFIAHMGENA